jgi:DNA-binding LacI/PurR family transcriptional regulator
VVSGKQRLGSSQGGPRGAAQLAPGAVITMRDVAEASVVSQSTVSRVLSGATSRVPIADATKDRILNAARESGYRPNPLARALRGMRTMLLGVIRPRHHRPVLCQRH